MGFFGFFLHAERDRAKRSNGIVCIMPFQDRDSSFKIFRRDEGALRDKGIARVGLFPLHFVSIQLSRCISSLLNRLLGGSGKWSHKYLATVAVRARIQPFLSLRARCVGKQS